jgi:hypothetical protein
MAQLPGYLCPPTPAAASSRPGSLLEILGALGPRESSPRAPAGRERTSVPAAVVAASAPARGGVGAPSHG